MPFLENFSLLDYIISIADIFLVWLVFYKLLQIIQGTKAVQLLRGIILIIGVRFASEIIGLNTLSYLMEQTMTWGVLAIIIIFQPELRRALEQLGRGKWFRSTSIEDNEHEQMIEAIVKSTSYMAKRRIGALMSIERETGLNDYIETGISLESKVTSVVSEETGSVSLTKNGELYRNLSLDELQNMLENELTISNKTTSSNLWNWRSKRNG